MLGYVYLGSYGFGALWGGENEPVVYVIFGKARSLATQVRARQLAADVAAKSLHTPVRARSLRPEGS